MDSGLVSERMEVAGRTRLEFTDRPFFRDTLRRAKPRANRSGKICLRESVRVSALGAREGGLLPQEVRVSRGGSSRQRGSAQNGATLGFEAKLWAAADALRGSMDAAEYKHVVLGLIFLKYISDAFEEQHAKLEAERAQGADPEDPDEFAALSIRSSGCRLRRAGRI